jgi:hypothetical protein
MSKAKFNSQDVELALAEFLTSTTQAEVPGLGYNGDITIYKEKQDGSSEEPSNQCD